jgi:HD-GYP domain-containing protein (c-di-GMP phosphodiesterase class II)
MQGTRERPHEGTSHALDDKDFITVKEVPMVTYRELYRVTQGVYREVAERESLDLNPLLPLAESLVAALGGPEQVDFDKEGAVRPSFYQTVMSNVPEPHDWAAHAVHVAVLAVNLGGGWGYAPEELVKLALASLLHGVGMMRIPQSVLEHSGPLTPEQRTVVESHPIRGAELIAGLGPEFEWLQTVILQEHERHRGQGYPHGLSEKNIHEYARIIGLADTFVSMTHPRPWRDPLAPYNAATEIVYVRKGEFDPRLIKTFIKRVTIFPVNSLVRLNNLTIGRVLIVHDDAPLRPTIEILHDPRLRPPYVAKVLDLRDHPLLHVVGYASEKDLP